MHEALVEHFATVGATALAAGALESVQVPAASTASLPPLRGNEAHVGFLAAALGSGSTTGQGRVASLDARRIRQHV